VLFGVSVVLLVRRLTAATPPAWLSPVTGHWETFACLAVVNLMILNVLAPYFRIVSQARGQNPVTQNAFGLAGRLTGRVLGVLFIAGTVTLLCVLAIRLYDRAVRRLPPLAGAGRLLERGAVAAIVAYCFYAIVLIYNGGLDRSPVQHHDSEILASYEVERPFGFLWLWFADLRSWHAPGTIERVLVFPLVDDLVPGQVGPGQPVRVAVRAGFLGIPRIERIQRDADRDVARIVDDIPGAAFARRRLTQRLVAEGRWPEVVAQVREYARHYPGDGEFFFPTLEAARRAGRAEELRLIQEIYEQNAVNWNAKAQRRAAAATARKEALAALPAESLAVAAEAVTLTGLDRALGHISRWADERQRRWAWYLREADRVGAAMRAAYGREALVETATRRVAARLEEPDAGEAMAWLRSPLSRRLLDVENQAESPARQEEVQEFVATLPEAPPDPARLAVLARVGRAMGVTYLHAAYYGAIERDFQRTTWRFLTPAGRRWADEATPSAERRLAGLEWIAFDTMTNLLTTYRPVSQGELEELARFSESPAGAWVSRAFRDGLLGAVEAAGERAHATLHGGAGRP
jgi:hypothetical protein